MNGRPFTRATVSSYISKGYTIQDFIDKYDFSDENEFKTQLGRIDPSNAERIYSKLKNKKEKGKKKSSKTPAASIPKTTEPLMHEAVFMIVTETKGVELVPKVDLTKIIKPAKAMQPEVVMLTDLEKLKKQLSENENYLSELSNDISEKKSSMKEKIVSMKASVKAIKDLEKKIEEEKDRFNTLAKEFETIEAECGEITEMKDIVSKEIEELKEKIQKLEVKKLFFGSDKNGQYDVFASDIEVPAIILMGKLNDLVNSGNYEEFSLGNLRLLAKMLCIIANVSDKYEGNKIEVIIEEKEYDAKVINQFKLLTESEKISFVSCWLVVNNSKG